MAGRQAVSTDQNDQLEMRILASRRHELEATADAVSRGIPKILRELFQIGLCGPQAVAHSEIVLSEVLNNIVEHSYAGQTDSDADKAAGKSPEQHSAKILIRSMLTDDKIWFELWDSGKPMPDLILPDPGLPDHDVEVDALPEGGFGWFMIRNLTEDLEYQRTEKENHLRFSIGRFC